ncbi:MAG: putative quinol monooxygenase [Singulisphaera sp.]
MTTHTPTRLRQSGSRLFEGGFSFAHQVQFPVPAIRQRPCHLVFEPPLGSGARIDYNRAVIARAFNRPAHAEPPMIYANILLTVKDPKDVPEIRELLREQGRLSRAEPGCARFEVYQSNVDEKRFFLIERWESNEALDLHRKAKAYTEIYQPKVLPKVERQGHVSTAIE